MLVLKGEADALEADQCVLVVEIVQGGGTAVEELLLLAQLGAVRDVRGQRVRNVLVLLADGNHVVAVFLDDCIHDEWRAGSGTA